MARPLRVEYTGAFYHIIQRGIENKDIFITDNDKRKFLNYLDFAHVRYEAVIHAYILMNNHYHMILETPRANLSKIMHYLNTSYAAYFNSKRKRPGPLYQGRFKAILIQRDKYLHHLSRYIHLNPVRAHIAKDPKEYYWSSYKWFVSKEKTPTWLNRNFILSMFDDVLFNAKELYKEFVLDGIGQEKEVVKENTKEGFILGDEAFLRLIKKRFIKIKEDPEIPILRRLKEEPTLKHIKYLTEKTIGDNKRLQRKLAIYLSRKYTQKTLKEIAGFYGKIRDTGVSQAFIRAERERKENKSLNDFLLTMEKEINV